MSFTERTVSKGIFNILSESASYPSGISPSDEITKVFNLPEVTIECNSVKIDS